MQLVEYWIDHRKVSFELDGATELGPATVLLEADDNVIQNSGWDDDGYCVAQFLPEPYRRQLCEGFTELIRGEMEAVGVQPGVSFRLDRYHRAVTDQQHAAIISRTRVGFERHQFPIRLDVVTERISEICHAPLTVDSPKYSGRPFFLRIVRPQKPQDNNPPHRDVWLDHLRDGVNVYVPIAGSNKLSSLPVVAGSHKWSENEIERSVSGARIQGFKYTVPTVTRAHRGLVMMRPNPNPDEVLVFSPYLIHGGALNLNEDLTRVSLEMRLWRRQ